MSKSQKQKIKELVRKEVAKTPLARHPGATLGRAAQKYGKVPYGGKIGSMIGKIAGTGDYHVTSDSHGVPGFFPNAKASNHSARIRHREYVGDVVASSTAGQFLNTSYPINPGLFTSFPWLCTIAQQYDQWKPIGMAVEFISTSSSYSGTSALGSITIAADYDVTDAAYVNKIEMNNSMFAVSGACADNLSYAVECKPSEVGNKLYYTRSGPVPSTDNVRWFDLCNLQVATYGATAGQVCGELWITYDVELYKAQLYGGISGKSILGWRATISGSSSSNPFGTTASPLTNSGIIVDASDITFPRSFAGGYFLVQCRWDGTSATCTEPALTFSSSCSEGPYQCFGGPTFCTIGAQTRMTYMFTVYLSAITTADLTVTLGAFTMPSSLTTQRLAVYQISPT
nr:MAG: capsid protein [Crogonang virus 51]